MKLVGWKQLPYLAVAAALIFAAIWLGKGVHGPRAFRCTPACALVEADGKTIASYGRLKAARVVRDSHLLLVTESGDLREDESLATEDMRARLAKVERFLKGTDPELWLPYGSTRKRWWWIVPLLVAAAIVLVKGPSKHA